MWDLWSGVEMIFELYAQKFTQFSYLNKSFMSYQL